jgi:hypothetical protein
MIFEALRQHARELATVEPLATVDRRRRDEMPFWFHVARWLLVALSALTRRRPPSCFLKQETRGTPGSALA